MLHRPQQKLLQEVLQVPISRAADTIAGCTAEGTAAHAAMLKHCMQGPTGAQAQESGWDGLVAVRGAPEQGQDQGILSGARRGEQGLLPYVVARQVAPCPLDAACVAGGLQAMRSVAPLGGLCSTDEGFQVSFQW